MQKLLWVARETVYLISLFLRFAIASIIHLRRGKYTQTFRAWLTPGNGDSVMQEAVPHSIRCWHYHCHLQFSLQRTFIVIICSEKIDSFVKKRKLILIERFLEISFEAGIVSTTISVPPAESKNVLVMKLFHVFICIWPCFDASQ